ncbi:MAG: VOC family protein [Winogradskyella sp.]|uniref:VOC family protein n=1 Tax=Winogradskyella sp. TaxID=1883156 RepID=UPI00385B71DB
MLKFSLNHIALSVKDVDVSVEFYQNIFQLEEVKNTASNSKTRWLSLNEGKELHLIPRPNFEIKINKAVHFALATTDINVFIEHLNSLNITYSDWLNTVNKDYIRNDGVKQVYFQDPDGYWIEVNQASS